MRLNFNIWVRKLFHIPFVADYCNVPGSAAWFTVISWIKYKSRYIWIRILISRTVTASVYKKKWMNQFSKTKLSVKRVVTMNCDDPPPPKTITPFYSSYFIVSCGYFAFSWVCWRFRRIRRICFLSGWGRLIIFYRQN